MSQQSLDQPGPHESQAQLDYEFHRDVSILLTTAQALLTTFLAFAIYQVNGSWTTTYYGGTYHFGWTFGLFAVITGIGLLSIGDAYYSKNKKIAKAKKQDQQDAARRFAAEQQRIFLAGGI